MRLENYTKKELLLMVDYFEIYPTVTKKDSKEYIISYLRDEACCIGARDIVKYLKDRYNTIKAILSFCHTPQIVIKDIKYKSMKFLYFTLENFCLLCDKSFDDYKNKFDIKGA